MGTSGGAIVAFLTALDFPEKVRAVIADSLEYRIPKSLVLESIMKERAMRSEPQKQFWEFAHGADWEAVVEADTSMLLKFAEKGGDWAEDRLGEVNCPVLLTGSKLDDSIPHLVRDYSVIAEAIADCSLYINNSGDHPFMWTAPQDFRSICDYFLNKLNDPG
jgi:pimeloyl-ACP methyl ester carboxylesterase